MSVSYFNFSDFGSMNKYWFNRPFHESKGYQAIEKDGKLYLVLNVAGVDKKDISISVNSSNENSNWQIISVKGETHNELLNRKFNIGFDFVAYRPMKEILSDFQNGFLTLEIEFNEPVRPQVSIKSK